MEINTPSITNLNLDEMVGWHRAHNGHEFEPAPGDGQGRGSLVCCRPCWWTVGHELVTEQQ